jgi:hypothetical protein
VVVGIVDQVLVLETYILSSWAASCTMDKHLLEQVVPQLSEGDEVMNGKDAIEEMERALKTNSEIGDPSWRQIAYLSNKATRLLAVAKANAAMVSRIEAACEAECTCRAEPYKDGKPKCPACMVWQRIHKGDQ